MAVTSLLNKVLEYNKVSLLDLSDDLSYDPMLMKGMMELVEYMKDPRSKDVKTAIIGDYDVDGVISTKMLLDIGDTLGLDIVYYIPNRKTDGYGLNVNIIEEAYKNGVRTIITCDNGIKAVDAIARAKELGMFVIVTDHHRIDSVDELPPADIIVNPNQPECNYPFKGLCGAGVVFKLMEALNIVRPDSYELLSLATVCDSMEILDENRHFVIEGLKSLRYPKNFGLCVLCELLEILDKDISTYHIGYIIGPHINAAGRLEDASIAVQLLRSNDLNIAREISGRLIELNNKRQTLTDYGVQKAIKQCKDTDLINVIYLEEAEEGIIGIIAQRVVEYSNKPTFIFTKADTQNIEDIVILKGSGRSLKGYDMYAEVDNISYLLESYGGHEGAAGLSIRADMFQSFRECLNEVALQNNYSFKREYKYLDIKASDVTVENIKSLKRLEPFGRGNLRPTFRLSNLQVLKLNKCGANRDVIQFNLTDGNKRKIRGVAFRINELVDKTLLRKYTAEDVAKMYSGLNNPGKINIIGELDINEYKDNEYPQVIIRNIEICEGVINGGK